MLLILVRSGCLRGAPSVHVQNPHGFKGEANISCVSTSDKRVTIQIDANGMAAAPCPLRESPVFIDEDVNRPKLIMWSGSRLVTA